MAHVLCIYICILSRDKGSSRVFQINMVSELAILAKAASGAERSARTPGGGRAGAGDQLAALAPPLRDAEEERAALGARLEAEAACEARERAEDVAQLQEAVLSLGTARAVALAEEVALTPATLRRSQRTTARKAAAPVEEEVEEGQEGRRNR